MNIIRTKKTKRLNHSTKVVSSISVLAVISAVTMAAPAFAAQPEIGLGTATAYSVIAGQTVTNTGPTKLNAGLGLHPGSAITGFPPGIVGGAIHKADAPALQSKTDLVTAYNDAASRATSQNVTGDLVGKVLPAGVYTSSGPLALSGQMTLDGKGDPSSVFIFQVASTLTTASASSIIVTNGAQACNVYWQVGSSATLGTNSSFKGTVMALASITVTTGAKVEGRALARNGAVTLDNNVFSSPGCNTSTPAITTPVTATTGKTTVPGTSTVPQTTTITVVPQKTPSSTTPVTTAVPTVETPITLSPEVTGEIITAVPKVPSVRTPNTFPPTGIFVSPPTESIIPPSSASPPKTNLPPRLSSTGAGEGLLIMLALGVFSLALGGGLVRKGYFIGSKN